MRLLVDVVTRISAPSTHKSAPSTLTSVPLHIHVCPFHFQACPPSTHKRLPSPHTRLPPSTHTCLPPPHPRLPLSTPQRSDGKSGASLAVTTMRSHWRAASARWAGRSKRPTAETAWWTTATRTFSSTRTARLSASTPGERKKGRPLRSKPPFRPQREASAAIHRPLGHVSIKPAGKNKWKRKQTLPSRVSCQM